MSMHPWPPFDIRVRTPRLELRLPSGAEVLDLLAVAQAGVHPPDTMPFGVPWTRAEPPEFERGFVRHHWRARALFEPDDWHLALAVFVDGEPCGAQSLYAKGFATRRCVGTGSWLGERFQRAGIGTEMRAAVLHLAFAGLGALRAESGAIIGNEASVRVSQKLGYADNGTHVHDVGGQRTLERLFVLEREAWEPRRRRDIELDGVDRCLDLLGAAGG